MDGEGIRRMLTAQQRRKIETKVKDEVETHFVESLCNSNRKPFHLTNTIAASIETQLRNICSNDPK
jgi:hypothetical protein